MKLIIRSALLFSFIAVNNSVTLAQGPMVVSRSANSNSMVSRTPDSRGWTDPALNHNKLLQQQTGDGVYQLIGPYKVIGSPFLFGERHKGNMFSKETKAYNVFVSYNTYNQEVEFYSTSNPDKSLIREPGTLDSFHIFKNEAAGIAADMKFIFGASIGSRENSYYQEIAIGGRFSLFKRYKSDLGYVSNNIAQSELRQFDLGFDYYYADSTGKGLKKIKANAASFIKEFKAVKDLTTVVSNEDFTINPETAMQKAIAYLNKQ